MHQRPRSSSVCDVCDEVFNSRPELVTHRRSAHPSVKEQCFICKRSYPGKILLKNHNCSGGDPRDLNSASNAEKPPALIKCRLCKTELNGKQGLSIHFRYFHKGRGAYLCPVCKREFENENQLFQHARRDHPEDKETCPYCDRVVFGKVGMSMHANKCERLRFAQRYGEKALPKKKKGHKKALLTCRVCELQFNGLNSLMLHFRQQHPDVPTHKCYDCGEELTNVSRYASHREQFHTDTASTCCLCNRTFKLSKDILEHECPALQPSRYKKKKRASDDVARDMIRDTAQVESDAALDAEMEEYSEME